ncbi:hypothetical protein XBJ2_730002 [Xenorhabdus bovienii str. Jollieti]|uniref:Uncharacterized protein n=1 Tax=Xenorhabdus bovienii (strain SS-2004) TaxID=406818 RepID=D3V059_XENBS|nr:hypothetical protein [Xenorhabdus bovienii]CBJ80611.1 hypothetical protein XBJ1_1482 [Xenorhabdus bovienii SS-2004]CDH30320.1 hypothetical protein XBJ2_730002 [Xenorhabdus bovienii str. Jollieti]
MAVFAETGTYMAFSSHPYGKKEPLLWPVMVHRVLYPDAKRPQLNIFQRAVLGLIRARVTRPETMAELTGLHSSLINLILVQSASHGWLVDNADALTASGERLLDDEDDDAASFKSGYLLQDAVTGQFWPRLITELKQIEPVNALAKYPEFITERKTGKPLRPYVVASNKGRLAQLDPDVLMKAYKNYSNDFRASRQLDQLRLEPEIRLQGVQRLDDNPQSARVLIWVTPDKRGADLWSVKDPFALRENAPWLQEALRQVIERDAFLLRRLEPLVEIPQAENQSVTEWLAAVQRNIEFTLLTEYPWAEKQPDIKRYMTALLIYREKIQHAGANEHELEAAITECQKLLEVVMQWLIRTFPANVGLLPKYKQGNTRNAINQVILEKLNIPSFTQDVIRILSGQHFDKVERACRQPTDSLKALLFAAAIGAYNTPQHPLNVLEDRELQLTKMLELARLRNQSGHGQSSYTGKTAVKLTSQSVLESIQYALSVTERFEEWM